jgi:hypothetical protein
MVKVSWSPQAEADLRHIDPAVTADLFRYAEENLHDIAPCAADAADEGIDGEIMWHRAADGDPRFTEGDGPWNYFLFYTKQEPSPGIEIFEILAVRSIHQVASMWAQMSLVLDANGRQTFRALPLQHRLRFSQQRRVGRT